MARPRKNTTTTTENAAEPAAVSSAAAAEDSAGGEAAIRRKRRRRQSAAPDYADETEALIAAALKSRGAKGATQETLQSVIAWARSIRAEGEEIKMIQSRPRRPKTQASAERIIKYDLNRALLDGILAGSVLLDVQENGELRFLHGEYNVTQAQDENITSTVEEGTELTIPF